MLKTRRFVVCLAVVAGCALMLPPAWVGAKPAEHQNANLYARWDFSENGGFWNVDQHLVIERRARSTYWAQTWSWIEPGRGGYAGLQTRVQRFDGTVGDTAIFSLWDAHAASGPSCGPFADGGIGGWSCRVKYRIRTARLYRLRVLRLEADANGQWWGAWIRDEATGTETHIGNIAVAPSYTLMTGVVNFSGYFGRAVRCGSVPVSIANWTQPAANVRPDGSYDHYSTYGSSGRGSCTGGSVTPHDFGWTRGVRIIQGGSRDADARRS